MGLIGLAFMAAKFVAKTVVLDVATSAVTKKIQQKDSSSENQEMQENTEIENAPKAETDEEM